MYCTPIWGRFCLYFSWFFFTNSPTFVGKKLLWKRVVCVASSSHPVMDWQPVQGISCHSVTAGPRRPGGNELKSVQPTKLMVKPLSVSSTLLELDAHPHSCVSSWEKSSQGSFLVWGKPSHRGATMQWADCFNQLRVTWECPVPADSCTSLPLLLLEVSGLVPTSLTG